MKKETFAQDGTTPKTSEVALYKVEQSRIFKKSYAPMGHIFLIVTCKDKWNSYKRSFPVLFGTPQERLDEMAETMYQGLKKQYSL